MKKQVLTLTVCLALTASTVFASCPIKPTVTGIPTATQNSTAFEVSPAKEQMRQKFEEKMAKHRDAFYNELGLTQEQKDKALEMDTKDRVGAKPLMDKIFQERNKLNDLTSKNACPGEILKQKKELKAAKIALHDYFKESRKNFEAILTKEQLKKLEKINVERKAQMKKHCKGKGHHHCYQKPCFDNDKTPILPCPMDK